MNRSVAYRCVQTGDPIVRVKYGTYSLDFILSSNKPRRFNQVQLARRRLIAYEYRTRTVRHISPNGYYRARGFMLGLFPVL